MSDLTPQSRFTELFAILGQPENGRAVSADTLEKYRGKLPNRLLEYWQEYGFCNFADGLFWLTNPEDYEDILTDWLPENVQQDGREYYVIARSGWGELFIWEPTYGNKYCIIPHFGFVTVGGSDEKMIRKGDADFALELFFLATQQEYLDMNDNKGKPLFQRAVKKFGALAQDEMFSFVPALAAGGEPQIGNVDKVNLFAQFDVLRQLVEPRVFNEKDMIAHGWGGKPL